MRFFFSIAVADDRLVEKDEFSGVNKRTGIITISTDEYMASYEIKHAASFARGINKVNFDGIFYSSSKGDTN